MELIVTILSIGCIIAGFVGSFLPVVPGPPISYLGLLLLQLTTPAPFGWQFMIIWALVVGALMILDNVIPAWGTKKFGGSAYGIWGSIIGLVVGVFFSPVGIVVGPLAGAFIGELVAGQSSDKAFRAALGSFAGLLGATLLKVIAAGMMGYYVFTNVHF